MKEIKFVILGQGEKLLTNVDELHGELLKLPAEMYVDLYHMMKSKIKNSYYVSSCCISAGSISTDAIRV